jgi:hypothetical protein
LREKQIKSKNKRKDNKMSKTLESGGRQGSESGVADAWSGGASDPYDIWGDSVPNTRQEASSNDYRGSEPGAAGSTYDPWDGWGNTPPTAPRQEVSGVSELLDVADRYDAISEPDPWDDLDVRDPIFSILTQMELRYKNSHDGEEMPKEMIKSTRQELTKLRKEAKSQNYAGSNVVKRAVSWFRGKPDRPPEVSAGQIKQLAADRAFVVRNEVAKLRERGI